MTSTTNKSRTVEPSEQRFPRWPEGTKEYRFKVSPDYVRSFKDPHNERLHIHHAYVPVRVFQHGKLPDDVNPRSHENLSGRVPEAIDGSLKEKPEWFHLLNRGLLVLAQQAWYDNKSHLFHVVINSPQEGGLADGATTDRVLRDAKQAVSAADFDTLADAEIPDFLKDAFVHVEVISGEIGEMLVPLTGARNTSNQVKEFSLENLGGGFEWLKEEIEASEFRGRVRYKENDPQPVDVRTVLALLTMFHHEWDQLKKEPVLAYTSKGSVIDYYRDKEWRPGYEALRPVVVDILRLYEYIHVNFQTQYENYKSTLGTGSKLGLRKKEIRYSDKKKPPFKLPLTGWETKYLIADGWLYPLLASFRQLLAFPKNGRGPVKWVTDPQKVFDEFGHEFVADIVEQSYALGQNPNATGKSRPLWNNLRTKMELYRMKFDQAQA
jgi:hypothetical protein